MEKVEIKIGLDASEASKGLKVTVDLVKQIGEACKTTSHKFEAMMDRQSQSANQMQGNAQRSKKGVLGLDDAIEKEKQTLKDEAAAVESSGIAHKNAGKSIKDHTEASKENAASISDITNAASALPGPIGDAASSVGTLMSMVTKLMNCGWLWFLAAVAAAYEYLTWSMGRTVEGQEKLDVVTAKYRQRLENVKSAASAVGRSLFDAFDQAASAASNLIGKVDDLWGRFRSLGGGAVGGVIDFLGGRAGQVASVAQKGLSWVWNSNVDKAGNIAEQQNTLYREMEENKMKEARLNQKIAESRERLYDTNLSHAEREKAYKEALAASNELFDARKEIATQQYAIQKGLNSLSDTDRENLSKENDLAANLVNLETERANNHRMLLRMKKGLNAESKRELTEAKKSEKRDAQAKAYAMKQADEQAKLNKQVSDAEMDASIASIRNKGERERAEREEQYKRKLRDIRDQADEVYKLIYEQRKKQWELAHEGSPYENTEEGKKGYSSINARDEMRKSFTAEEKQLYVASMNIASAQTARINAQYAREEEERMKASKQAINEYLKEYGTLQEQKLAIAKEFAEKIHDIENSDLTPEAKQAQIASVTKQQNKDLAATQAQDIMQQMDWAALFQGTAQMAGIGQQVLANAQAFTKSNAFKDSSAEDKKAIYDAISQLMQNLQGERGIFGASSAFSEAAEDVERFSLALTDARQKQEEYAEAINMYSSMVDSAEEGPVKDFASSMLERFRNLYDEQSDIVDDYSAKVNDASARMQSSAATFQSKINSITSGLNSLAKGGGLSDMFGGVSDLIKGFGGNNGKDLTDTTGALGKAGGYIGAAFSLADMINEVGLDGIINNISNTINGAVTNIAKMLMSPDFYKGILTSSLDAILAPFNAIFGDGNFEEMQEEIDDLTTSNEDLQKAMSSLEQALTDASFSEVGEKLDELNATYDKMLSNNMKIMEDRANMHKATTHSLRYYFNDESDYTSLLKKAGNTLDVNLGGDLQNLLNLSPEQLKRLFTEDTGTWTAIKNAIKDIEKEYEGKVGSGLADLLDAQLDLAGKKEEWQKTATETLSGISFDSMRDNFKATISDMKKDVSDFADDIEDTFDDIVLRSITEGYEKELKQLQSDIAKAAEDEEWSRVNELKERYRRYVEEAREKVQQARDQGYYNGEEDTARSQQASGRSFRTMSQETGDELSGRFTALQISGENIDTTAKVILWNINIMSTLMSSSKESLSALTELAAVRNTYLNDILAAVRAINNFIAKKLTQIESNTNYL